MPRISFFHGISIFMFYGDHPPAHFHAAYGDYRARVGLGGEVLAGMLPTRAAGLVKAWALLHRVDLMQYWDRVTRMEPPGTIAPLP